MKWIEKWQPKKVNEVVGNFKEKITNYLKDGMPDLLFYSKVPGTGKTTLAMAIIGELGCDALILGSGDDRSAVALRREIKEFIKKSTSHKCVLIEEFDMVPKDAQEALRSIMGLANVFFILTTNDINKVIDPLKNRCIIVNFSQPDKAEILGYLVRICNAEGLSFQDEALDELVNMNYPSIRGCVSFLQDVKAEGKSVTLSVVRPEINKDCESYWQMLKGNSWRDLKQIICANKIDARELNFFFWSRALEEENLKVVQICCRNERDIAFGANAKVVLITSLVELCR